MAKPPARAPIRVLMVCMGNICRSPTAEGMLRAKLKHAGVDQLVEVDSAGTHGHLHAGEAPDPRAQQHALKRGLALSKLRARRVVDADFRRFDHILAMDGENLKWLLAAAARVSGQSNAGAAADGAVAEGRARIGLLMDHSLQSSATGNVPDPYYGPPQGFEHVLDLLDDACEGLVRALARDLELPRAL